MMDFITWLINLYNFLLHLKDTYEIKTVIIIICLNLPFEVKNQVTFYKVRWFKWSYWQRCFDVAQRCSIQRWKTQPCFNFVQRCNFQRWRTQRCFNVDLTLRDVAASYQPKNNVEPTSKCLLGRNWISVREQKKIRTRSPMT